MKKKIKSQHIEWLMQRQNFDEINKFVEYSQFFEFNFTKSYLLLHPMSMCPFIRMPRIYLNLTAPFFFSSRLQTRFMSINTLCQSSELVCSLAVFDVVGEKAFNFIHPLFFSKRYIYICGALTGCAFAFASVAFCMGMKSIMSR